MYTVGLQSVLDQTGGIWVTFCLRKVFRRGYNLHELYLSSIVLATATSTASGLLSRGRIGLFSCEYTVLVYTALPSSP